MAIIQDILTEIPMYMYTYCKDTKTLVGALQMPDVDSQVICRQIGSFVAVDRNRIDVVGVGVGEYSPWESLHRDVLFNLFGDFELCYR